MQKDEAMPLFRMLISVIVGSHAWKDCEINYMVTLLEKANISGLNAD